MALKTEIGLKSNDVGASDIPVLGIRDVYALHDAEGQIACSSTQLRSDAKPSNKEGNHLLNAMSACGVQPSKLGALGLDLAKVSTNSGPVRGAISIGEAFMKGIKCSSNVFKSGR